MSGYSVRALSIQCSHAPRWSVTGWLQRHSAEDNSPTRASFYFQTFSLVGFLSDEGQPRFW